MIIDPFLNNPNTLYYQKFMSHLGNDEILERLYEEELDDIHLCILKESEGN